MRLSISHHKNRLCNFDPLKPVFYIVKLGFTGVDIIFLILLKNIDCGYSLELTLSRNMKIIRFFFLSKKFSSLVVKFKYI